MTSITTNLIEETAFDNDAFDRDYSVFKTTCADYTERADFCDRIKTLEDVLSVRNSGNMRDAYILCRRSGDVGNRISDIVRDLGTQGVEMSMSSPSSDEVPRDILLQLLLNSMTTYGLEGRVSNITGRMLCPVELKRYRNSDRIEEVITLEFSVKTVSEELLGLGSRLVLAVNVRTLTNLRSSRDISFVRKPSEEYPRFVLTEGTLVRAFSDSPDQDLFIMRKKDGMKSSVDMMDFSDVGRLERTKAATIEYVLDGFNRRFGGITELRLHSLEMTPHSIPKTNKYDKRTVEFYRDKIVRIINRSSAKGADEVIRERLAYLKIRSVITKQNGLSELCMHIVNPIGTENDRSYIRDPANTIQHITSDHIVRTDEDGNVSECLNDTVLKVNAKELMIKDDVRNGRMTLYDWKDLEASGNYLFGRPVLSEDGKRIERLAWISVAEDGSLDFGFADPFTDLSGVPSAMMMEYMDRDGYFAIDPDGNCVTVSHTDVIAVPSAKPSREKLRENSRDPLIGKTTGIRANREKLFPECTDIKYMELDSNTGIYMTGVIGSGMQSKVPSAANFRLVKLIRGDSLFMDKLVEMMDVPFIRYNQTTVIPFPVKYLDEWMKMQP